MDFWKRQVFSLESKIQIRSLNEPERASLSSDPDQELESKFQRKNRQAVDLRINCLPARVVLVVTDDALGGDFYNSDHTAEEIISGNG